MRIVGRLTAVSALIDLARSPDPRDRADAGRCLSSFADLPQARTPLVDLVLDARNTVVTRETAVGLLRRKDSAGLDVMSEALASADDQQLQRLSSAVNEALGSR